MGFSFRKRTNKFVQKTLKEQSLKKSYNVKLKIGNFRKTSPKAM